MHGDLLKASRAGKRGWPFLVTQNLACRLLAVAAAVPACTAPAIPDPAAVRLAALTSAAAADSIDDLQAVDNPDAAGVREAFRNATREALAAARQARDTAPATTSTAFASSLEAAEAAERLGDALVLALEARDDFVVAREFLEQQTVEFVALTGRDLGYTPSVEGLALSAGAVVALARSAAAGESPTEWKARGVEFSSLALDVADRLTVSIIDAAITEGEAADRAKQTMKAAEAQVDEAVTAYRSAMHAWRALLE